MLCLVTPAATRGQSEGQEPPEVIFVLANSTVDAAHHQGSPPLDHEQRESDGVEPIGGEHDHHGVRVARHRLELGERAPDRELALRVGASEERRRPWLHIRHSMSDLMMSTRTINV